MSQYCYTFYPLWYKYMRLLDFARQFWYSVITMTLSKRPKTTCKCGKHYDKKPGDAIKTRMGWLHRCGMCGSTICWLLGPGELSLPDQEFSSPAWED